MELYKFKITIENQQDFIREVLIKPSQNFEDFHLIIKKCIDIKDNELASFYTSDEDFNKINEITLLDMSENNSQNMIMRNCTINDFVDEIEKYFIYEYDFLKLKTFKIEFIGTEESKKNEKYPKCISSKGKLETKKTEENFNIQDMDEEKLLKDFEEILKGSDFSDHDN